MKILLGVIGTVLGFFAGLFAFDVLGFSNKYDPIASGMTALFLFGPLGAVAGAVLGTKLAMIATRARAPGAPGAADKQAAAGDEAAVNNQGVAESATADSEGGLAKNSLKSLGIVVAVVSVVGGLYAWYAIATATPWLNRNADTPRLLFEVRLPLGSAMPDDTRDIHFDLQIDQNTMPGEVQPARFRRDGDRPVIAGEVELAFRTRNRELEMKIKGRMDRTYQIRLTDKAPHTAEFRPWEAHPDGSEIRYRAKWPGRE